MEKPKNLKDKRDNLQSEARDKTAKIIAGMIPMGSASYELITTLVVPLHEKKKQEFINDLATRLKRLEKQGKVDFKELAENEEFNTIITKAILLAQQNHQKEKIIALKSLVINSTLEINSGMLDYEEQNMYLRIVERIDATQFIMLKMFYKPKDYLHAIDRADLINSTDRISTLFLNVYPDFKEKIDLLTQMWAELHRFGLVSSEIFSNQFSINTTTLRSNVITSFGIKFLELIDNPNN
jgi:hypothetical protein